MSREEQLKALIDKLGTSITDQDFLVGWKGTANQFLKDFHPQKQQEFLNLFTQSEKKHEIIAAARRLLKSLR